MIKVYKINNNEYGYKIDVEGLKINQPFKPGEEGFVKMTTQEEAENIARLKYEEMAEKSYEVD